MKKKLGIAIGTGMVLAVVGLGIYQSEAAQAEPKLSSEEISQLIQTQYPGTISEMEVEKESNKVIYEVDVKGDGLKYELKLDGDTGEVVKEKKKEVSDDNRKDLSDNHTATTDVIGDKKAKEIALQKFDGEVIEFELDDDDNHLVYEIEIRNSNKEAEFEIDAVTGDILEMEIDTEDDDD